MRSPRTGLKIIPLYAQSARKVTPVTQQTTVTFLSPAYCTCKTLEHIVASPLSSQFNPYYSLWALTWLSSETLLWDSANLSHWLSSTISKGKQTDLIILDFSKAFKNLTTLNFLALKEHGVSTQVLNWTHSILIGCSQTVVLDGDNSTEVPVTRLWDRD